MYSELMSETFGDVKRLTRALHDRIKKTQTQTDKRSRKKIRGAEGVLYSHWMLVVHDREELIDRKHLGQRLSPEELLSSL